MVIRSAKFLGLIFCHFGKVSDDLFWIDPNGVADLDQFNNADATLAALVL